MADGHQDRKRLTFEQAEGVEPLPRQLQLRELSKQLRATLWAVFYQSFQNSIKTDGDIYLIHYFGAPWSDILYDKHFYRDHKMVDEFKTHYEALGPGLKRIFGQGDYVEVFGFVQWVLRHRLCPPELQKGVEWALRTSRAAYRVVDKSTIVPLSSPEEGKTIEQALADVSTTEFHGARIHLLRAASDLTEGNWPDSIRESIHAVESVARVLDPTSDTLGPALVRLEKQIRIHGALKAGFGNLYGYTSDEEGVRHALLGEGAPQVDEADALYMLGSCAAFVSYLISKARLAGFLKN